MHQTIRVSGSAITSISDHSASADGSPDALGHAGAYVLPGLIDLHVHHPLGRLPTDAKYFALLHLAHGVTTVRDCGSIDGSILAARAAARAGTVAGPRIFACGPLIDGDPPFWPGARIARSAAEGERIVDDIAAAGVDCVKTYSNLSADALRGVRAGATRHRLPLIGHVPIAVPFEEAGLDEVQHLTGLPRSGVRREDGGLIAAILRGWDTIDDTRIDSVVRASRERRIAHTPTLFAVEQLLRIEDDPALLDDPGARLLPRSYRELFWRPRGMASWSVPPLEDETRARIRRNFCTVVRRLHEAGVLIHVGSDTFNPFVAPGVSMHEELRRLTRCGFSAEEAWEAATRQNGASLPLADLGVIAPGAPADLLVFGEDPTRDLAQLATLRAVVAGGRVHPKPLLDRAVARYRGYFDGWLYDRLSMLVFPLFAGGSETEPSH